MPKHDPYRGINGDWDIITDFIQLNENQGNLGRADFWRQYRWDAFPHGPRQNRSDPRD